MSDTEFASVNQEKQKKGGAGIFILVLIAAAIVAGLFFFKKQQNESIVTYAPEDTSMIVFLNTQKLNENKVWKAARVQFKDGFDQCEKDMAKDGIDLNEILKSQLAVFVNFSDLDNISGAAVLKFQDKLAGKYFNLIKEKGKEDKDCSAREVEGKPGLEVKNKNGSGCYIVEASEDMIQLAGGMKYNGKAALLKKTETAIARKVDADSILCVAFDYKTLKNTKEIEEGLKEVNAQELVAGLSFITLTIKENKNKLETCLIFAYDGKEQAAKAGETAKALLLLGKKAAATAADKQENQADSKKAKEMIERLEIKVEGSNIILSSAEDMDDIIAQMKANSDSLKESAKNTRLF